MGPWLTQCTPRLYHVLEMPWHVVLFTAVARDVLSLECRPGIETCARVHWAACSFGTVFPTTRGNPLDLEAHHTSPSLPEFQNNVMFPSLIHLPSRPVHSSLHSSIFHYCISHTTVCTCSTIRDDKIRCSKFTLIPFMPLYHLQPFHILT